MSKKPIKPRIIPDWLPDWQDEKQYPDAKKTTPRQWAWQFLRRNSEYQKMWQELIAPYYNTAKDEFDSVKAMRAMQKNHKKMALPGQGYHIKSPLVTMEEKFGIKIFPPSPSQNNAAVFFQHDAIGFQSKSLSDTKPFKLQGYLEDVEEICIHFDVRYPIKAQLARAGKLLLKTRLFLEKEGALNIKQRRKRVGNYQNYLRLLDAKVKGVPTNQMAAALYPKIPNKYPDYIASQWVRDDLEAAELLSKKGYSYLSNVPKK